MSTTTNRFITKGHRLQESNSWHWDLVFKTCVFVSFVSTGYNFITLSDGDGDISPEGQFGIVSTVREVRRSKTPKTYARYGGPYYNGEISTLLDYNELSPLSIQGLGELEDSIGGVISGSFGLWRHGKIEVVNKPRQINSPDIHLVNIHRLNDTIYWNNRNADNCHDRGIFISGQRFPTAKEAIDVVPKDDTDHARQIREGNQVNQVWVGFIQHKCHEFQHFGYLTVIYTPSHNAPISGRVYKIRVDISDANLGPETKVVENSVTINCTELGSFMEDRGYGSRYNDIIKLALITSPFLIWLYIKARIGKVQIKVRTLVHQSSKVFDFHGYMDTNSLNSYAIPLAYIGLACVFYGKSDILEPAELKAIHQVSMDYNNFLPKYLACTFLLMSQEIVAWVLYGASMLITFDTVCDLNKGIMYGYQRCELGLGALAAINIAAATVVVLDTCQLMDQEWLIYMLGIMTAACNLAITLWGYLKHPYLDPVLCQIAGSISYCVLNVRGLANLMSDLHTHQLNDLPLLPGEHVGVSYHGELVDAIMITQPELIYEAFMNGNRLEVKILEKANAIVGTPSRITIVGHGRFELFRHASLHGTQDIILS